MVSPALTKNDRSPVTVADFAAQALIGSLLAEVFPSDTLVAEESSAALRSPENRRTLEQITEFVSGFVPQAAPQRVCDWIDRGAAEPGGRFWVLASNGVLHDATLRALKAVEAYE